MLGDRTPAEPVLPSRSTHFPMFPRQVIPKPPLDMVSTVPPLDVQPVGVTLSPATAASKLSLNSIDAEAGTIASASKVVKMTRVFIRYPPSAHALAQLES